VISENIIKAFDGAIGVESSYGKGSKFAFSIVLNKENDPEKYSKSMPVRTASFRNMEVVPAAIKEAQKAVEVKTQPVETIPVAPTTEFAKD